MTPSVVGTTIRVVLEGVLLCLCVLSCAHEIKNIFWDFKGSVRNTVVVYRPPFFMGEKVYTHPISIKKLLVWFCLLHFDLHFTNKMS